MAVSRSTRVARWGGAVLVALAPLPWLGFSVAQAADPTYATVTGYEPFSSDANHPDYWGDDCDDLTDGDNQESYVLTQDYDLVIVKAGAGNVDPYTNTLFANASAGETVWADTNGNKIFDFGGPGGDKQISHIIVCGPGGTPSPSPSESETTTSASPSESETTTSASPSESETTTSASPSQSTTRPAPSSSSASPSESETTSSASPSESETTGSAKPSESSSSPGTPRVTESESSGAAALPQTGSDAPLAGAVGISLLLIGVGVLLLLGPGRLMPAAYHRKH